MRINCIGCGHMVDLGSDYDEYNGLVKCGVCGALLEISSQEGNLKSVTFADGSQYSGPA